MSRRLYNNAYKILPYSLTQALNHGMAVPHRRIFF